MRIIALAVLILLSITDGYGHEIRPGYLELTQISKTEYHIKWKLPTIENNVPKLEFVLPSNYELEQISSQFQGRSLIKTYRALSESSIVDKEISISGIESTLIDILVSIKLLDGSEHMFLLQPKNPSAIIPSQPDKWSVIKSYTSMGFYHILEGFDHLLFILALMLIVVGWRDLVKSITSFTLAHSITLGLTTMGWIGLPSAPVEAVIALSILFLAREYLTLKDGGGSFTADYPWIVAFLFGLLHGFGFAGALAEVGLPQQSIPLALLFFNIGIEFGQLVFIILILILSKYLFSMIPSITLQKWFKVPSYVIGGIAGFWFVERVIGFWG